MFGFRLVATEGYKKGHNLSQNTQQWGDEQ